jgi:hypothetical protein
MKNRQEMQDLHIHILRFFEVFAVVFLCVLGGFARDSRSQWFLIFLRMSQDFTLF